MSVSGGCILVARGEVISVMVKLDGVHCPLCLHHRGTGVSLP